MLTGLCSVTFRKLNTADIVTATAAAGLSAIEFGSDVHVPPDGAAADTARELCADANIATPSYGSYYRLDGDFAPYIDAARRLGSNTVRIWAGNKGSADISPDAYRALVTSARNASALAEKAGITVAAEWHGGTVTDTAVSAVKFASETGIKLYWQPNQRRDFAVNLAELRLMLPYLANVHVFAWEGDRKLPLSAHARQWSAYLDVIGNAPGERALYLEFVPDDKPENLTRDAATLIKWVS